MRADIPRKWYAIYAAPRLEQIADQRLRRVGLTTFYPFCMTKRWRNLPHGRRALIETPEPHLPRYLFALLGNGEFSEALDARGVISIVRAPQSNTPLAIPDREIDRLMAWAEEHNKVDLRVEVKFGGKVGDQFVFAGHSPFAGLIAIIESLADLDTKDEIIASLKMLGSDRSIPVSARAVGEIISH